MSKEELAKEHIFLARMVKDFNLYTALQVEEQELYDEGFVTQDLQFSLKFVASYERKGRRDKNSDGNDKPRVHVNPFFRKVLSLKDYHELHGINESLKATEHNIHISESDWHKDWKERVKHFCDIEKRFNSNEIPSKSGYKIADAFYERVNTAIEFQKSFSDEAISKSDFYRNENIKLIWLFYLQTLEVFEDDELFKIREDNFYHFFRLENVISDFYDNNVVFIQDKNNRIFYVRKLERVETHNELEGTIRYFEKGIVFNDSDSFVKWLQFEWEKSSLYKNNENNNDYKSINEILADFKDAPDKMFYLQNCEKNDINGNNLIYCFVKYNGIIGKDYKGYIGYRSYIGYDNRYHPNSKREKTYHNPNTKKWILLATNCHKYNDLIKI